MRKLLPAFHPYGRHASSKINSTTEPLHLSQISPFDFATIPVIVALLLLSVLSLSFIFHLRLRSRVREFNNLWTVRVLLVLFISYWAINEIIRLPFFRSLTLSEQDELCKLHVVFSLGFLEPGFLITLLFIVNESVKERNQSEIRSVLSVVLMSLPTLILQIFSVFFTPLKEQLPLMMIQASLVSVDGEGNKSMTCTFPLVSSIIFGAFAVVYSVGLMVCCWRVVSLVINRNVRLRINLLGMTVITSLLVQSICLGVAWYGGVFMSLAMCAGVAEIVLVIKPTVEALVAGGDHCSCYTCAWWRTGNYSDGGCQ